MKNGFTLLLLTCCIQAASQELYVFTEPASNMPARSISTKLTGHFVGADKIYGRFSQRYMPEMMLGISKKWMVHLSATLGNMHTKAFKFESYAFYWKYRLLSIDAIHQHFRMAVFGKYSHTNVPFHYDEISLMGDKTGIEAGLIATQLWQKFALSGTLSHEQVLDASRFDAVYYLPVRNFQSVSYSLSAGYLLIPREYTSYRQLNINLYLEVLGQQILDRPLHYLDLAPAVQLIFNSNSKLNIGYRTQLNNTMQRMSAWSWQVSFEITKLNVLKKKKSVK